nr:unnamed protein product [uncultured bacterium]
MRTCLRTCLEIGVKALKISEFIDGRNVTYDTVRRYIKRNPELFKGHTGKSNCITLDEVAIKLLNEKYPLLQPVEVIEDSELMKKLLGLQEKYIQLVHERYDAELKIMALEHKESLLISTEKKKSELEEQLKAAQEKIETLENDLQSEKSKTWWDKLRGR